MLRRRADQRLLRRGLERFVLGLELRVFLLERVVASEQRVAIVPKAHRLILARRARLSGQWRSGSPSSRTTSRGRFALITPDIVTTLSASRRPGGCLDA